MFAFRCERFPTGVAHIRTASGTVVDFHDGRATVGDATLARELREVPAVFRIVQTDGPDPARQSTPRPRTRRR
jgi:hypothetical protein